MTDSPLRRYTLADLSCAAGDLFAEGLIPGEQIDVVFRGLYRLLEAATPACPVPAPAPRPPSPPVPIQTLAPAALPRPHKAKAVQSAMFGTVHLDTDEQLSQYQRAILDHLTATSSGDVLIDAVAGSGKTSTLVTLAPSLQGDALFLAFNRHVVDTMQQRIPSRSGLTITTAHALGRATLATALHVERLHPQPGKYWRLARKFVETDRPTLDRQLRQRAIDGLVEWAEYCRKTLTDPRDSDQVLQLVAFYGLEDAPELVDDLLCWVTQIIAHGDDLAQDQAQIDFTDMLYLPWRWQLRPTQVPWVLVDECQDLSAAMLHLALASRAPGGRMIFVGDGDQAINGFTGADPASIQRIEAATGAIRFPLPTCYRCPASHLELARALVPHIEARPGAPIGTVAHLPEGELVERVKVGDLILSRSTAPLLGWAFRLMRAGLPVLVRGHDLLEEVVPLIKAIERREGCTYATFGAHLHAYQDEVLARLQQRERHEQQLDRFLDRCTAVRVCYEHLGATSIPELIKQVGRLFKEQQGRVILSTVHRAKGSEAARVFILEPKKLPLTWLGQQPWEYAQELHIKYVALTRATEALYFVEN